MKKNSKGYYVHRIYKGRNEKGQILYTKIYARTLKELERKIKEATINSYNGVKPDNTSFGTMASLWVKSKIDISENTNAQYGYILEKYISPLYNIKIKDIVPYDLQNIINNAYSEGKSKSTLKIIKLLGTNIMNMAIENKVIGYNPFASVRVPKSAPSKEREPISEAQKQAILKHWQGHRMGIGALIMLNCGLRKGELLALKWSDIDFNKGLIRVNKTIVFEGNNHSHIKDSPKTKSGIRDIPLSTSMISALKGYRRTQKPLASVYIIPDTKGQLMTYQGFKRAWESFLHYLNIQSGGKDKSRSNPKIIVIERFTPHQLRHTFATTILYNNIPIKDAQYLLGHSNVQMTLNIYAHTEKERMKENISSMLKYQDEELEKLCNFE